MECPRKPLVVYPRWAAAQERAFGQLPGAGGGVRAGLAGQRGAWRKTHGSVGSFYENSAFSDDVSTHYVNLPHVLRLPQALDQRVAFRPTKRWRWQDVQAAAAADDVHPNVRVYAQCEPPRSGSVGGA